MAEAWTADSKAVLFVSNRNDTWKLFKQRIDETTAQVLVEGRSIFLPRLSGDGSEVLYLVGSTRYNSSFPATLMRKPLAGGPSQAILEAKGIVNYQCARAPATLCIVSRVEGREAIFNAFDLEHGMGGELLRIPHVAPTNWSLSPDGSQLAIFNDRHRIRFVQLNSGVSKDVAVKDWPLYNGDWYGKTIFMPSNTASGHPVILEVDTAGKAKVVFEGEQSISFDFMIRSPDGRHAILEEDVPGDDNAWMIENF
jgi:hypothetical protein